MNYGLASYAFKTGVRSTSRDRNLKFSTSPDTVEATKEDEHVNFEQMLKNWLIFMKGKMFFPDEEEESKKVEDEHKSYRAIQVDELYFNDPQPGDISGMFYYGRYNGEYAEIVDIKEKLKDPTQDPKLVLKKNKDHLELMKYYFRFHIPDGQTKGLMFLQTCGGKTPKGLLCELLNDFLKQYNVIFRDITLTPEQVFEEYVKKGVSSNRVKISTIFTNSDNIEQLGVLGKFVIGAHGLEDGDQVDFIVKKKNPIKDLQRYFEIKNKEELDKYISIEGLDVDKDVFLTLNFDETRTKTFKATDLGASKLDRFITNELRKQGLKDNQFPTYEMVHKVVTEEFEDIKNVLL